MSCLLPTITWKNLGLGKPWKKCACMNNKLNCLFVFWFGLHAIDYQFWWRLRRNTHQALIDSLALHNFTLLFNIFLQYFIIIISSSWQSCFFYYFLFIFYRSYFILLNIKYNEFVLRYRLCTCTLRLEFCFVLFNAYDLGVCGNQFDIWPLSIPWRWWCSHFFYL